jgi:hypothetical protein
MLPFKADTILTLRKFSTYCQLPINGEICASPYFTPPQLSEKAIFPPRITTGTALERNSCPRRVQKYQINLTQSCISTFLNFQLSTAIPYTN